MAQTLVTKCQSLGAPQLTQAWRQKKDKSWTPQAGLRLASQRRQALSPKNDSSLAHQNGKVLGPNAQASSLPKNSILCVPKHDFKGSCISLLPLRSKALAVSIHI
ncbi:MAG: hypothetical protein IJT59_07345 [Desulfovibrionaceae bacterium]|nr:hypothetical protein [Desulfovibrionaceae bacterium]